MTTYEPTCDATPWYECGRCDLETDNAAEFCMWCWDCLICCRCDGED